MIKLKPLDRDVRNRLETLPERLKGLKGVSFVYLFGSFARGEENRFSDIDIAYYISTTTEDKERLESELYHRISSHLKTDEITFLSLNEAPVYLSYRIIVEGVLIYETNKNERLMFIEKTIKLYLDFLPFLKEMGQAYED